MQNYNEDLRYETILAVTARTHKQQHMSSLTNRERSTPEKFSKATERILFFATRISNSRKRVRLSSSVRKFFFNPKTIYHLDDLEHVLTQFAKESEGTFFFSFRAF